MKKLLMATVALLAISATEASATWSKGQGSMRPDPGTRANTNVFPGRYPSGTRFKMPMGITGSIPTGYRQSLMGEYSWRDFFRGWVIQPTGQPVNSTGSNSPPYTSYGGYSTMRGHPNYAVPGSTYP